MDVSNDKHPRPPAPVPVCNTPAHVAAPTGLDAAWQELQKLTRRIRKIERLVSR